MLDPAAFIRARLPLRPVPGLSGIVLHTPDPGSGLWRLLEATGSGEAPPYWAYVWAGGAVLARHISEHPHLVAGRRVLDLGAGCGIVAIAAARADAASVSAVETDPNALVALELNAAANNVALRILGGDILDEPSPADIDLILVGDLFYDADLAHRVTMFLDRCLDSGISVLIGDPFRAHLPVGRLQLVVEYEVPDVGGPRNAATTRAGVFSIKPRLHADLTPG
jgi:predicted nicotinamide N-methyase